MKKLRSRRSRRLAIAGAGSFGLVVAAVSASLIMGPLSSASRGSSLPTMPGNNLPRTQLPNSSGLAGITGMTQVLSGRVPLWTGKDGTGPYSETSLGFTGSLQQGFVLSSALTKFGKLNHGLPLPLPQAFATEHPGPAEVFDFVWAFSNRSAPQRLLYDPNYNNSSPGTIAVRPGAVHGGRAWQIVSQANGGMQEYMFKWADGTRLAQVAVVGAHLSLQEARLVALRVGR